MMLRAFQSLASRIERANLLRAANRADYAVGPALRGEIAIAVVGIREVNNCVLAGFLVRGS